jgi:hypothetical protein
MARALDGVEVAGRRDLFFLVAVVAFVVGGTWAAGTAQVQARPTHPDWVLGSYTGASVALKAVPRSPGAHGWLAAETAPWPQGLRYSVLGRHAALLVVAEAAPRGSRSLFRYGWMDWWRRLQVAGSTQRSVG